MLLLWPQESKKELKELGVDEFIDYTKFNPVNVLSEIDLVVDSVGGKNTGRFLKTIKNGGSLFPIFPLGFSDSDQAEKLGVHVSATQVRSSGAQFAELADLLEQGIIKVVIESVFPLAHARKRIALRELIDKISIFGDN